MGDGNAGVESGGGMVAECECIGGSRVMSSADDVLEMSVMRGVEVECVKWVWLRMGGVG